MHSKERTCTAAQKGQVDDITWNDLDMDEVFERLDSTLTDIGREHLYAVLRNGTQAQETLLAREKLMDAFENEALRLTIQRSLSRLGHRPGADLPALLYSAEDFSLPNTKHLVFFAVLPFASLLLLPFAVKAGTIILFASLIINCTLFQKTKKRLENRFETISYLLSAFYAGKRLLKVQALREACPAYCEDLQNAMRLSKKLGFGAAMLAPSPQSDAEAFAQMIGMITLWPLLAYEKSIKCLLASLPQLRHFYANIGEIDAAIALLSYRKSLPFYAIPTPCAEFALRFDGLVHPLLHEAKANSAEIASGWLLTGSNASGKSTFIKAIAINLILGQTINTCTAHNAVYYPAPVLTSMAVADSVICGESYFVAEIKSMRRIVDAAMGNAHFYCFIDEILKGTNTSERVAASAAVLRYLAGRSCICVAATHDIALTDILKDIYCNMHFSEQVTSEGVSFDYCLKSGASKTRNAIRLLEYYQYPKEITSEANALCK